MHYITYRQTDLCRCLSACTPSRKRAHGLMYAGTYAHAYLCTHACMRVYIYICTHVGVCRYIYIYVYRHINCNYMRRTSLSTILQASTLNVERRLHIQEVWGRHSVPETILPSGSSTKPLMSESSLAPNWRQAVEVREPF